MRIVARVKPTIRNTKPPLMNQCASTHPPNAATPAQGGAAGFGAGWIPPWSGASGMHTVPWGSTTADSPWGQSGGLTMTPPELTVLLVGGAGSGVPDPVPLRVLDETSADASADRCAEDSGAVLDGYTAGAFVVEMPRCRWGPGRWTTRAAWTPGWPPPRPH